LKLGGIVAVSAPFLRMTDGRQTRIAP
jgi:hypothetical protein